MSGKTDRFRNSPSLVVLRFIQRYQQQHAGLSPSERRIRRALGMSALSVVHLSVHRLTRWGLLTVTTYGQGRSADLRLTEAGYAALEQSQTEWKDELGQGGG